MHDAVCGSDFLQSNAPPRRSAETRTEEDAQHFLGVLGQEENLLSSRNKTGCMQCSDPIDFIPSTF